MSRGGCGHLGGAVATHLRLEQPLLSTTLFSVWVGLALWAGLALRDPRVRDRVLTDSACMTEAAP